MSIDKSQVKKIAHLARIKVSDKEIDTLENELNSILHWVEQLNNIDTDGVMPLTSVIETTLKKRNDVISDAGYPDQIIKNAPKSEDDYFLVPKVVE